jgi:hypothetical protein
MTKVGVKFGRYRIKVGVCSRIFLYLEESGGFLMNVYDSAKCFASVYLVKRLIAFCTDVRLLSE